MVENWTHNLKIEGSNLPLGQGKENRERKKLIFTTFATSVTVVLVVITVSYSCKVFIT
jgi:hypothetical protein